MSGASSGALERWAGDFAVREVPVLQASTAMLAALREKGDEVAPREIAAAVLRDPMLTLTVLRHLQTHHSRRMLDDITTVEHAVMMLGTRRFLAAFDRLPAAETLLGDRPDALAGLLQVVARARTAAVHAAAVAAARADLARDQVVAAALLHDMAEMLLWCFAPGEAAAIASRLEASPGLRSAEAQRAALGVSLLELQLALARRWGLPDLIQSLMDDSQADKPRVQGVACAVALTRHAWRGWDDAALPSDYEALGKLLGKGPLEVRRLAFDAALLALAERESAGERLARAPLPPLPRDPQAADGLRAAYQGACEALARRPRGGLPRDTRQERLAVLAALLDGMCSGLGFASGAFFVPAADGRGLYAQFGAGRGGGLDWLAADAQAGKALADAAVAKIPTFHRVDEGQGLFAWPVVARGGLWGVAVALEPRAPGALGLDSFRRLKELGRACEGALRALEAPDGS